MRQIPHPNKSNTGRVTTEASRGQSTCTRSRLGNSEMDIAVERSCKHMESVASEFAKTIQASRDLLDRTQTAK